MSKFITIENLTSFWGKCKKWINSKLDNKADIKSIPVKLSELINNSEMNYVYDSADSLCDMADIDKDKRVIDDVDFFNLMLEKYQNQYQQSIFIKTNYSWNDSVILNLYNAKDEKYIVNLNGCTNIIVRGNKIAPKSWGIIQFTIIIGKNNSPGNIPVNSIVNGTLTYDGKDNLIRQVEIISNKKKLSELTNDCNFITKDEIPTKISAFENDKKYLSENDVEVKVNELTADRNYLCLSPSGSTTIKGKEYKNTEIINISQLCNDKGYITKDEIQTDGKQVIIQNNINLTIGTLILLPSCVERPDGFLPCDKGACCPIDLFGIDKTDISTEFRRISNEMAGDNIPGNNQIYLPNYESPKGTIYYIKYK